MTIKTLDPDIINKRIAAEIAKYPPNSVSKREIVATVPLEKEPEKQFGRLDARLTTAIYNDAVAAYKRNAGLPLKVVPMHELERLTSVVRRAAEALKS